MPLPELRQPIGTPCFLLAPISVALDPLHDDSAPMSGHERKRKTKTSAPRVVTVAVDLSAAQAAAYDAWFETVLDVGNELFTAEIAKIGEDSRYWAAQWVGMPVWTPRAAKRGVRWRLEGQLLLTGQGSDEPPQGTTLAVEYVIALTGSAAITSAVTLAVEYEIALEVSNPFAVEYEIDLLAVAPTFRLREAIDYRLREAGGRRKRERDTL